MLPSLVRLAVGYALAVVVGIALGVAIGSIRGLRAVAEPVLEFFRAIPPPVLVPVIMLFAGIGDTMKVLVIVSGCVWPILLNTVEGVRAVDEVLRRHLPRLPDPRLGRGCGTSCCAAPARRSLPAPGRRCRSRSSSW